MTHLSTHRRWLVAGIALSLIGFFGFLTATHAASRLTNIDWKEGVIILNNEEVLNGKVFYDHRYDLVLLRSDDDQPVKTYSAHQVQSFRYYDPQDNIIHDFITLAHHPRSSYPVPNFYEVVTSGKVLYLRQQNHCPLSPPRGVSPHKVAYHYFAYYEGQLVRAHRFEKDLLPTLAQEDATVGHYLKEHRLRPYEVGDQILLVKYFNQRTATPVAELASF